MDRQGCQQWLGDLSTTFRTSLPETFKLAVVRHYSHSQDLHLPIARTGIPHLNFLMLYLESQVETLWILIRSNQQLEIFAQRWQWLQTFLNPVTRQAVLAIQYLAAFMVRMMILGIPYHSE